MYRIYLLMSLFLCFTGIAAGEEKTKSLSFDEKVAALKDCVRHRGKTRTPQQHMLTNLHETVLGPRCQLDTTVKDVLADPKMNWGKRLKGHLNGAMRLDGKGTIVDPILKIIPQAHVTPSVIEASILFLRYLEMPEETLPPESKSPQLKVAIKLLNSINQTRRVEISYPVTLRFHPKDRPDLEALVRKLREHSDSDVAKAAEAATARMP